MPRTSPRPSLLLFLLLGSLVRAASRDAEVIDPNEAKADPDFAVQGEYQGRGTLPDASESKAAAQVVALSEGKFHVLLYRGGLPGDGWKPGDDRFEFDAQREEDEVVRLRGDNVQGRIAHGKLVMSDADGKPLVELARFERSSPTLGLRPPEGAVVLFDGSNADLFQDGLLTEMGTLEAGTRAKNSYTIARLHLEFRLSWMPTARGQRRSNSGVYIGGIAEIQVLDSFGLEGRNNECGGFYGRRDPDVNMCLPPLVWQTYDVEFGQPPRNAEGAPTESIRVTVRHNGVIIHDAYDTRHKQSGPRGLNLQGHSNRVQYRNIWLVETGGE